MWMARPSVSGSGPPGLRVAFCRIAVRDWATVSAMPPRTYLWIVVSNDGEGRELDDCGMEGLRRW